MRAVICMTELRADKASPSGNRVPSHTGFSGSRLENKSHPRISTCPWKWAGDSQMDAQRQGMDQPICGFDFTIGRARLAPGNGDAPLRRQARHRSSAGRSASGWPWRESASKGAGAWSVRCGGRSGWQPLVQNARLAHRLVASRLGKTTEKAHVGNEDRRMERATQYNGHHNLTPRTHWWNDSRPKIREGIRRIQRVAGAGHPTRRRKREALPTPIGSASTRAGTPDRRISVRCSGSAPYCDFRGIAASRIGIRSVCAHSATSGDRNSVIVEWRGRLVVPSEERT
jgi:hypothetical protein